MLLFRVYVLGHSGVAFGSVYTGNSVPEGREVSVFRRESNSPLL